ncbi:MAG TPA: DUF5335 family protein [Tepidisphaeraceae bacterium]|nr:DUF5335 family protein [Tepidisphaeraceae bacterium]
MEMQQVPEDQWVQFANAFSRSHVGQPVTIDVLMPDAGRRRIAQGLPLQGISFDLRGTRPASVQVSAGKETEGHVSHVIDMPMFIRLTKGNAGEDVALEIEPARGPMVQLVFGMEGRLGDAPIGEA